MGDCWLSPHFASSSASCQLRPPAGLLPGGRGQGGDTPSRRRLEPGLGAPPTWFSLCCRLSSSCSKGHCSRLASSSSFFFLMSWFRLRCSRTRCSSGLLSTPRPLGGGSRQETPTSPSPSLRAAPRSDTNLYHCVVQPPWQPQEVVPFLSPYREAPRT